MKLRQQLWSFLLALVLIGSVTTSFAHATSSDDDASAEETVNPEDLSPAELAEKLGLTFQTGTIVLPGDIATLQLPDTLKFLDGDQTKFVIEDVWGNPEGSGHLGMIVPADVGPFGEDGWGVIVSFDESGYISDEDAQSIDYNELLAKMRSMEKENNDARRAAGYESVHLEGWATPPHYDSETKKLHWAKELTFGDGAEASHVLNYNIRVLGRRGYLELNAVADILQLGQIEEAIPSVLTAVEFNDGHRYVDFDPTKDRVAEYGIAALVLGGVAAKSGLLKGVFALLLAAKKLVVVGVLAVGGFISKLFGRKATG
ncbi:MAG: DUF2167 domain-containing protein [Planctomycetales bacterium]|nr:DUF2167 domain-containing protein [Planctomycetales bacterium]